MSSPAGGPAALSTTELTAVMSGENGAYVEALFEDYLTGRQPVPETWIRFFDALMGRPRSRGNGRPGRPALAPSAPEAGAVTTGVVGLVNAYRTHGHLIARLDPLGEGIDSHPLLDPAEFGLADKLDQQVGAANYLGPNHGTARELIGNLRQTYCGTFAVEFMEITSKARRDWLIEQMEPCRNRPPLEPEERRAIFEQMLQTEERMGHVEVDDWTKRSPLVEVKLAT